MDAAIRNGCSCSTIEKRRVDGTELVNSEEHGVFLCCDICMLDGVGEWSEFEMWIASWIKSGNTLADRVVQALMVLSNVTEKEDE